MAARPIKFPDWQKFQTFSSQKHVFWNYNLVGMLLIQYTTNQSEIQNGCPLRTMFNTGACMKNI